MRSNKRSKRYLNYTIYTSGFSVITQANRAKIQQYQRFSGKNEKKHLYTFGFSPLSLIQ